MVIVMERLSFWHYEWSDIWRNLENKAKRCIWPWRISKNFCIIGRGVICGLNTRGSKTLLWVVQVIVGSWVIVLFSSLIIYIKPYQHKETIQRGMNPNSGKEQHNPDQKKKIEDETETKTTQINPKKLCCKRRMIRYTEQIHPMLGVFQNLESSTTMKNGDHIS